MAGLGLAGCSVDVFWCHFGDLVNDFLAMLELTVVLFDGYLGCVLVYLMLFWRFFCFCGL
jgi:hypothetical protein